MRTSFRLTPSLSPSLCSAVSGNDHQAEADWAAGAVPMLPRRGGGDFGVGLLALQPAAGPQGDLQLWENSGGALPRCQPDWGTAQGNTPFSYHSSRKTVPGLLMVRPGIFFLSAIGIFQWFLIHKVTVGQWWRHSDNFVKCWDEVGIVWVVSHYAPFTPNRALHAAWKTIHITTAVARDLRNQ